MGRRRPSTSIERWRERAAYTREPPRAARAGITARTTTSPGAGVPTGHGLDDCTDRQRDLRVLLARHLFNVGRPLLDVDGIALGVARLLSYDPIVSPRLDDLVLYTDHPGQVARCLAGRHLMSRLPGMRLTDHHDDAFGLTHLPSGATLTVTAPQATTDMSGHNGRDVPTATASSVRHCLTDTGLDDRETAALAGAPAITPDAAHLIAAVLVRTSCVHPHGGWAIGHGLDDPLGRPRLPRDLSGTEHRALAGSRDRWELRWSHMPFGADVVGSLVDPIIGLVGVTAARVDGGYDLAWGTGRLALRPRLTRSTDAVWTHLRSTRARDHAAQR